MGRNRQVERFIKILRQRMPELKERYNVTSLGVFGSYVREGHTKKSDLDLLVDFEDAPSLLTFLRLEHDLSDLLGVKVDLVMRDALRPTIAHRILSELVPV
jgi:hypothetical protein